MMLKEFVTENVLSLFSPLKHLQRFKRFGNIVKSCNPFGSVDLCLTQSAVVQHKCKASQTSDNAAIVTMVTSDL